MSAVHKARKISATLHGPGRVRVFVEGERSIVLTHARDLTPKERALLITTVRGRVTSEGESTRDEVLERLRSLFPDTTALKERQGSHAAAHAHPAGNLPLEWSLEFSTWGWTLWDSITEMDRGRRYKVRTKAISAIAAVPGPSGPGKRKGWLLFHGMASLGPVHRRCLARPRRLGGGRVSHGRQRG